MSTSDNKFNVIQPTFKFVKPRSQQVYPETDKLNQKLTRNQQDQSETNQSQTRPIRNQLEANKTKHKPTRSQQNQLETNHKPARPIKNQPETRGNKRGHQEAHKTRSFMIRFIFQHKEERQSNIFLYKWPKQPEDVHNRPSIGYWMDW